MPKVIKPFQPNATWRETFDTRLFLADSADMLKSLYDLIYPVHQDLIIQEYMPGDDSQVVLTVSDTGVGIPQDEQAHIFERFHRVRGDQQSGSGIGLALVADMTAAHGGSVEVASEPGKGSQFVVVLLAMVRGFVSIQKAGLTQDRKREVFAGSTT